MQQLSWDGPPTFFEPRIRLQPVGKIKGELIADRPEVVRGVRMIFTTQGYGMGNNVFFPKKAAPPFPPWPADGFAEAKTDERGRFIVPMIAHGDLLVEVRLDEDLPLRPIIPDHLTVSAGLTTNLEFHMVPTVPVRGSIREGHGQADCRRADPYLLRRPPPGSRCGKRCTGEICSPGVAGPRRVAGNLHAGEVRSPGQWTDPALCSARGRQGVRLAAA